MIEKIRKQIEEIVKNLGYEKVDFLVEVPADLSRGDFTTNVAFLLAKKIGKNPVMLAEEISEKIDMDQFNIEVVGPYINFKYKDEFLLDGLKSDLKINNIGKGKKIIIDYSSPNIAKHFGIHNLRSTLIGHAIYNVVKELGYDVVGINYPGDWGTQFGKLVVAYKKWGEEDKLDSIEYLNELYVKFHKECDKSEEIKQNLEDRARSEFKKIELKDEENYKIWQKFVEISYREFNGVYNTLGIKFDKVVGESEYAKVSHQTVEELRNKNLLEESQGAQVVRVGDDIPPAIITKSDGATTYVARDVTGIIKRITENPEKILYVVASPQSLHFEQVFRVAEKLGYDRKKLEHVKFGLLKFIDGKMSTRKGQVIKFKELLKKASEKVEEIISQKNPDLDDKQKVAEKVALSAIIYNDLAQDRLHDVVFDWNKALSFEGKTGPYLMYTYARANSILKKVGDFEMDEKVELNDDEKMMIRNLNQFGKKVEDVVGSDYKPSVLAEYLYNLSNEYNSFYHKYPVLKAEDGKKELRSKITQKTCEVLKNGLKLLGIEVVEKM